MTIHKLEIHIIGKDDASGPLGGVSNSLGRMRDVAGGMLAAQVMQGIASGFMNMAAGAAQFLKDSVMSAARVEEMDAVLRTLAKNAGIGEDVIYDQIDAIKELGITTQSAQWVTAQFTRWQLNMSDATRLASVAQDSAVISMQDSSHALKGLMHGITTMNTRVLRTYGITLASTIDAQDEYAKSIGKTRDELEANEKIQAVLNAVIAQGTQIEGAYEAAMGTAGKQLRSMKRHVVELMNTMGAPLLNVFSGAIEAGTGFLKWMRDMAAEGEPLGRIMESIGSIMSTIFGAAFKDSESTLDKFAAVLDTVADFLNRVDLALGALLKRGDPFQAMKLMKVPPGVIEFLENLQSVAKWLGFTVEEGDSLNDFLADLPQSWQDVLIPIGNFIELLQDFFERNWPLMKAAFLTGWELIKANIESAIEIIRPPIENLIQAFKDLFTPERIQIFATILAGIGVVIGAVIQALWGIIVGVIAGITDAITVFVEWFGTLIDAFGTIIEGIRMMFEGNLQGGLEKIWEGIKKTAESIWKGLWETLLTLIGGIVEGIVNFFIDLYDRLTGNTTEKLTGISDLFVEKFNEIVAFIAGLVTKVYNIGKDVVQGLWDGLKAVMNKLKSWWDNTIGALINKAKDLLGIGSPSSLFKQYGQWLMEGLGEGIQIGIKKPALAFAGVAPAIMGAGPAAAAGGTSNIIYITVPGAGDPTAVAEAIVSRLRRQGVILEQ